VSESSIPYGKLSVLVIEDESYTRRIICQLLHNLGVRSISQAEDGEKGFLEVVRTRPDLVLCDIYMKPSDGMAFLRKLHHCAIGNVKNTPVIFLTADAQEETVSLAKQMKVNGYLVKPVSQAELKKRVDGVLASKFAKQPAPLPTSPRV
jgi:two-component system, chemotaxis family, chemotaxis protein CheY